MTFPNRFPWNYYLIDLDGTNILSFYFFFAFFFANWTLQVDFTGGLYRWTLQVDFTGGLTPSVNNRMICFCYATRNVIISTQIGKTAREMTRSTLLRGTYLKPRCNYFGKW